MVEKNSQQITSVNIEVEFETLEQIKILFGSHEPGGSVKLCDGDAELKLISTDNRLAFDGGFTVELLLSFSMGVACELVASAILSAIRSGIKKLEINGRRTRTSEESVSQALETIKKLVSSTKDLKHTNKIIKRKLIRKKSKKKRR